MTVLLFAICLAGSGPVAGQTDPVAPARNLRSTAELFARRLRPRWHPSQSAAAVTPRAAGRTLPPWLAFHGEQRTRFESIDHRLRQAEVGGDEMVLFRTRAQVRAATRHLVGVAEVQDSRVAFTDSASTITSRLVFDTQMAQLSAGVRWPELGRGKLTVQLEVGRFSREYGMGRLISRLIYANISNIQDGVVAGISGATWTLQALAVVPVIYTYPDIARDPRFARARFGGLYATSTHSPRANLDLYMLHLDDGARFPAATRRRLYTPGARAFGAFGPGNRIDYEVETALQWGEVGALDHRAHFEHVQVGYSWPRLPLSPRLLGLYDYATGDADPTDRRSGAFDTLYGRVRFEFGPSGMFGVMARSNMRSPGLQLFLRPSRNSDLYIQHRWGQLAQARDRWRSVGVGDPTGSAGRDVGTQLEVRIRYRWRRYFEFDGGFAHFREGRFARTVRPLPGHASTIWLASSEWRF